MKKLTFSNCFRWQKTAASKNNFSFALLFVLAIGQWVNAQTVLINPNAEGGFENGTTFAANGWTTVDASINTWNVGAAPGWFTGTNGAYVSNDAGATWAYGTGTANRSSFYRDITFPANPLTVTLTFDWRGNGNDGNYDNLLVYLVDTSVTPTTAGPTGTNTTTTGWTGYTNGTNGYYLLQRNGTVAPTTTTSVSYSLTAAQLTYVAGATKRLIFVWKNDGGGGTNPPAAVDNISLVAYTCPQPTALVTTAFTATTATVGWTAPTSVPANGYEYEVRTSGAAGSGAAGLFASGPTSATSLPLTGLTANTLYTYYVRSSCSASDFSAWSSATLYTGYCIPSSTSSATYINNFSTTGGLTNISNLNSGYTATGYQNNYATASVSHYPTGTINFTTTITGGTVGTAVWVDWNNDLTFDNATERVYVTADYGNGQTGSFVVPNGTALGDYRMRVRIDYNAIAPDACSNANTRTEAEDYKLTVVAQPACLAPSGLTATANTAFTATLNWTASVSTPGDGYDFYYSDVNTAPTSGTTVSGSVGAGVLTAPISGLDATTKYYVWIRSNCGSNGYSDWSVAPVSFTTPCNPPTITGTTPGSICGQGSAALAAAVSAGDIKWYAAATGGSALGTGATFNTPSISTTTSYWVEASEAGALVTVGPASPTAQGGTLNTQTVAWNVDFTVLENATLASVDIFPMTAGQTGEIVIRNSTGSTVIATYPYTTSVSGGTTAQTVVINHAFAPGNYQLYPTLPTGGLRRNTTGAVYPYTSSVANITGNGYDPAYFMGFYNWTFRSVCASPRTEVVATVTTPPALTLSANATSICPGQPSTAVTLTDGGTAYDTFVWSPAGSVTGDAVNGWVFNPTVTTTYTLTASQSAGALCATTATVAVTVRPAPIVAASTTQNTICEGSLTTLNATATLVVGTASTLSVQTEQPTAFANRWDQYWNQTIFTAAELQAAGLVAGNISSIAFNITTLGSGTNVTNFSVRIGNTTNTTTPSFVTTGLNLVYGPATYTHAVGVNTIAFDTPYVWDGTSNIIVDIRQDGADSTNNSITYYTATATNMTISAVTTTDSAVTTLQDLVAATTVTPAPSVNRLNVVFGQTANGITWSWSPGSSTGASVVVAPSSTTTYTATGTNTATGCSSPATVAVTVNPAPAPTGNAIQVIEVSDAADATIASINVTGNNVVWYATEEDAIDDVNPLPSTTQLVSGTTYYAMQTTTPAGCRSVNALAVTVTVALGNASFDLAGLKYYPNPTTNVLNVEYTGTITSIEVYNMLGQQITANKVDAISTTVDMSRLASGTYFVKVQAENAARTIKVVKN